MTDSQKKNLLEKGGTRFIIKNIYVKPGEYDKTPRVFKTLSFDLPNEISYSFYKVVKPNEPKGNMFIEQFNKSSMKVYSVNILYEFTETTIKYKDITILSAITQE